MTVESLTVNQRWLLWGVGLNLTRALISDDGLTHYFSSMLGGHRHGNGGPEWFTDFATKNGRIVAPGFGDPRIVVTRAEIKGFRKAVPGELLAELKAIDRAQLDEGRRTAMWCRCSSREPHQDFMRRDRYHPTDDEDAEHLAIAVDLIDRERDCLRRILGIDVEPVGQLELFEVAT